MRFLQPAVVSLLALAALALPASGLASDSTVTTNRVTASVRMTGSGLNVRVHLKIDLNGRTLYNQAIHSSACPPGCITTNLGGSKLPLRTLDLQSTGTPNVVLGLFTGGAHCCFVDQVYSLDPGTMKFTATEHNFLDAGARISDLNGDRRYEFLSADARIAEEGFTDFADSGAPIQIFAFQDNRFRDVTGRYPSRIKADAARWLSLFNHNHSNGRGLIAAWVADEYRLGNTALINSTLATALKRNELRAPNGFGGPSAAKFVSQLKTFLRRLGYTR